MQRQLLLRPSDVSNGIFLYVLAVAAQRFGIALHAFCVLSNHVHLVLTDPDARLPAFEQYLSSLVARAVNASLGRWEAFWAIGSYSAVALVSPDDIVSKAAYVLANPVAAGLVARGRDWPGLWTAPDDIGTASLAAARPPVFFRATGYMPESAELELVVPPGFSSPEAFRASLCAAVADLEEKARRAIAAAGRAVMGAARVLAQRPWARPAAGERRRELKPRVAARDRWKRMEALSRIREFVRRYREALSAWRRGARATEFPAGTYLMRVAHGVACCEFG